MIKTDLNFDIEQLKELFWDSEEALLVINDKNIKYQNKKALCLFKKVKLIDQIEHLFSFDICILDNENILNSTPLKEAIKSTQNFKSEVLLQTGENEYKNFLLRSFKNSSNTIIFLYEITPSIKAYEKKISELEKTNKDYAQLQEKAQNLAIKTGLVNRISNSIRDNLNIDTILEKAVKEITETLGLDKGYFVSANEMHSEKTSISMVMTDKKRNFIQPKLVTPIIYRDETLGALVFFQKNSQRNWHEEEIALIEGIASQLATMINNASLFETTVSQNKELEQAIKTTKETQSQLIQSEKMASLGQLVAGVAHEINTPLGSINSNNNMFGKCLSRIKDEINDEDIVEIIEELVSTNIEATNRINTLVKSLKNFARLDEAEYQETDIHDGIKSTLSLINHELKGRIEVIEDYNELPLIKCFPNQLNQVFMNILVNAYQSIDGKGTITIKTEKQGNNAVVTISDTGKGIPEENLSKIFDPGFTTKGVGVGTGLGLSICYQIMEKHKGKISVNSKADKGTTFTTELPVN